MRKSLLVIGLTLGTVASGWGQSVGDQYTAGYTPSRTYLNSDQGDSRPPFALSRTIDLAGVTSADSLLVFTGSDESRLLVGEGAPGNAYRLFDAETGAVLWSFAIPGHTGPLNYTPSFAGDIVLLGGAATTGVAALQVSTGTELWRDNSVGDTSGRLPVLTTGLAIYGGRSAIVAANPLNGPTASFWRRSTTTAEAPISFFGNQAYFLTESGDLRAVNVRTGMQIWSLSNLPGTNPNIISTQSRVFVNSTSGVFGALDAASGIGIWAQGLSNLSETPAMALAYDRLYLFTTANTDSNAEVTALDANTGNLLWSQAEEGEGIDFGFVANNVVYYYLPESGRIRARDAFTGNLIWSRRSDDVRAMAASGGFLYVLHADQVDVFEPVHQIYFAQIADGGGQRTLVTLNNPGTQLVQGTLAFFDDDGAPLVLEVSGSGNVSSVPFAIPPQSSIGVQTTGSSAEPTRGWAQVTSEGALSGSSIFEFVVGSTILTEAGVANSEPTGRGSVFVEVILPPTRAMALSTGVAVANPGDEEATVSYSLLDTGGAIINTVVDTLVAGGHTAVFAEQLFSLAPGADVTGTLLIEADVPLVVTALRTQAGLQLSSYVVGQ